MQKALYEKLSRILIDGIDEYLAGNSSIYELASISECEVYRDYGDSFMGGQDITEFVLIHAWGNIHCIIEEMSEFYPKYGSRNIKVTTLKKDDREFWVGQLSELKDYLLDPESFPEERISEFYPKAILDLRKRKADREDG